MTAAATWRRLLPRALLLLALAAFRRQSLALSSVHDVHGRSTGCRFTERMFADGHGPWGLGGRSTVAVHADVRALLDGEVSDALTVHRLRDYFDFALVVVSYTAGDGGGAAEVDERAICARNFSAPSSNGSGGHTGAFYGEFHALEADEELHVTTTFHPSSSGLQVVLLVPCWKQKSESFGYPVSTTEFVAYPMADPLLSIDATISFRNPYGYLPALLFGLFPFKYAERRVEAGERLRGLMCVRAMASSFSSLVQRRAVTAVRDRGRLLHLPHQPVPRERDRHAVLLARRAAACHRCERLHTLLLLTRNLTATCLCV